MGWTLARAIRHGHRCGARPGGVVRGFTGIRDRSQEPTHEDPLRLGLGGLFDALRSTRGPKPPSPDAGKPLRSLIEGSLMSLSLQRKAVLATRPFPRPPGPPPGPRVAPLTRPRYPLPSLPASAHQTNRSPLMIAASEGHTGVVEMLLDKRAEVDTRDKVRGPHGCPGP